MGKVQPELGSNIQEEAEQNQQELVTTEGHLSYDSQEREVRRSGRNRQTSTRLKGYVRY